jgi:hypothetical protein
LDINEVKACELAAEGQPLKKIAAGITISPSQLARHLDDSPDFARRFQKSREIGIQLIADDLTTIVEDNPLVDFQTLRLKSDNIKWIAGKLLARIFGDKIEIKVEAVDLRGAIEDGRKRAHAVIDIVGIPVLSAPDPEDPFEE